jgi:hypothetical protein
MISTARGWDYVLQRALEEELAQKQDCVVSGGPTDWGGYQRLVGEIYGIQVAIKMLFEVREKWNRDGDEDFDDSSDD